MAPDGNGPVFRFDGADDNVGSRPRIGIAIAGCGAGGRKHLAAIHDLAELMTPVALIETDQGKAAHLGRAFGVDTLYRNIDEALEDRRIRAIVVSTPPAGHANVAERAVRAGRHVMIGTPIVLSLAQCDRVFAAAREADVVVMAGNERRFTDSMFTAREIVRGGQLGQVTNVTAFGAVQIVDRKAPWWNDPELAGRSTMLYQWVMHGIDQIQWVTASQPVRLYAEAARRTNVLAGFDELAVLARFADDAIVQFHYCATPTHGEPLTCHVTGTAGTLSLRDGQHLLRDGKPVKVVEQGVSSNEHREPFVSAARERCMVAMLEAILRSAEERRPVEMSEFGDGFGD